MIFKPPHLGWKLKSGFWCKSIILLERYSRQSTNKNGDSGSPCLKPLSLLKNPCKDPLKAREKEVDVIHAMIHEIKVVGNCRAASMSLINAQSIVSKVFLKSIFKVHLGDVLFLLYCLRSSCRRKIL